MDQSIVGREHRMITSELALSDEYFNQRHEKEMNEKALWIGVAAIVLGLAAVAPLAFPDGVYDYFRCLGPFFEAGGLLARSTVFALFALLLLPLGGFTYIALKKIWSKNTKNDQNGMDS